MSAAPPRPLRAAVYDWDGTLLDSAEASFRCYVKLFGSYGITFDRASFERTYSPDWYRTYRELGLPEASWSEANDRWLDLYRSETCPLLPGAAAALDALHQAGVAQGLVTSGSSARVEADLARLGLASRFDVVVAGGDVRHRKPHPEGLLIALDRLRVGPTEAAYVGDSPEDIEMAHAAGVFAVAVPGGFPNRAALLAARPQVAVRDVAEAAALLVALAAHRG